MGELKNICLSCGICCEGVMVGFVLLDNDEIPVQRNLIDIEEEGGHGLFFLPCKNQTSKGCKIYSQRSKRCRLFKCRVLSSVENGELEYDAAVRVIEQVKQMRTAITKQLHSLPFQLNASSFFFKIRELHKLIRDHNSALVSTEELKKLLSDIKSLDQLLLKHFGVSYG